MKGVERSEGAYPPNPLFSPPHILGTVGRGEGVSSGQDEGGEGTSSPQGPDRERLTQFPKDAVLPLTDPLFRFILPRSKALYQTV